MAVSKNNGKKEAQINSDVDEQIALLHPNEIFSIKADIARATRMFSDLSQNNLTTAQRRKKTGAGIRNYGFIEKTADIAEGNQRFASLFRITDLRTCIRNMDACRDIIVLLQTFIRIVSNSMMTYSDEAYSLSLLYYNTVKEMARRGDPGAIEIFKMLQPFFKRPRRSTSEPTAKELEKDLNALIHGRKDGKILVENQSPHMVSGKYLAADETFNNKGEFRETKHGEV